MKATARAARKFFNARPGGEDDGKFPAVVNGFTGSSIWHAHLRFSADEPGLSGKRATPISRKRWTPILDVFEKENVNFALEVHPTEIAFDIASAQRALAAVRHHPRFGFNYDPSHLGYQGVDYVKFIREFADRIFHVHMKDVWWGHGDGTVGVFGGHTDFTDARRYWDFRSLGHGDIKFEDIIVALNDVGYRGPLSVEWEDGRMDRVHGATEAAAFVRKLDFTPNAAAFDAAFSQKTSLSRNFYVHSKRKLRYGMVGGGRGAFIGAVHRMAADLDGQMELVAGCFSSDPEKSTVHRRGSLSRRRIAFTPATRNGGTRSRAAGGRAARFRFHRHAEPPARAGGDGVSANAASTSSATSR